MNACDPYPTVPAVQTLIALLEQLFDLVESLSDGEYVQRPVGVVESSISGHVRHNLDHVEALIRGLQDGEINYDRRDRGTAVERDRAAALGAIRRLQQELDAFAWAEAPTSLTMTALVAPDLPPLTAATSPRRELAFVVGHTIHHNALIRVMVMLLGASVPADFGYAPATVAYNRERLCAR